MLHRLATAYRTVFAKIDLTASDQHAGFALAAALQACLTFQIQAVKLAFTDLESCVTKPQSCCHSRTDGHKVVVVASCYSLGGRLLWWGWGGRGFYPTIPSD